VTVTSYHAPFARSGRAIPVKFCRDLVLYFVPAARIRPYSPLLRDLAEERQNNMVRNQVQITTHRTLAIVAITLLFASAAWAAPNEVVLHPFNGNIAGGQPLAGLISDSLGNL